MVAVLAAVRSFRRPASPVVRALAVTVAVLLVLLTVGGVVNAYYAYVPTLGEALGDVSSLSSADGVDGRIPATGQVVPLTVPPTASNFSARQAQVYLPPAWFAKQRPALPVVMLTHGEPGDPSDWAEGGEAPATADAWAAQHRGVAPVLVMPDINGSLTADTECVDSPVGNAETYLTVDVPAAVQQQFHPADDRGLPDLTPVSTDRWTRRSTGTPADPPTVRGPRGRHRHGCRTTSPADRTEKPR